MSAEYDYINSLLLGQQYLYQYGGPILIAFGTISCIISLIVFTKKNLRKSSCSIYYIALNISNFLLIYISVLISILQGGYHIDPSLINSAFCRFQMYASLLFDILGPFYLILASIDRVMITSANARIRQYSTRRFACICVVVGTLFWALIHIHGLIYAELTQWTPTFSTCYFQLGTYLVFIGYYVFLVKAILVPLLLIFFGLWAIKNVRNMGRVRVAFASSTAPTTASHNLNSVQPKDRQLVLILLSDIILYIIFSWMLSIFLMYQQITQYNTKSPVQSEIELVVVAVLGFSYYITFCIGSYTKLIISKTFRNEVKNFLLCK